jgi:acyl dehydratase
MVTTQYYLEDASAGDILELGSRTVSEAEILAFARDFDPQPFHIDPEAAAHSIFGGIIASGWHTCALTMRLMVDSFSEPRRQPGFARRRADSLAAAGATRRHADRAHRRARCARFAEQARPRRGADAH